MSIEKPTKGHTTVKDRLWVSLENSQAIRQIANRYRMKVDLALREMIKHEFERMDKQGWVDSWGYQRNVTEFTEVEEQERKKFGHYAFCKAPQHRKKLEAGKVVTNRTKNAKAVAKLPIDPHPAKGSSALGIAGKRRIPGHIRDVG